MASLSTQETETMCMIEGPITIPAHASAPARVRLTKRYNTETQYRDKKGRRDEGREGREMTDRRGGGGEGERERVGLDKTKGKKWCK